MSRPNPIETLSPEQKRAMLKQLVQRQLQREGPLQQNQQPLHRAPAQHAHRAPTHQDTSGHIEDHVEQFSEVRAFEQQFTILEHLQIGNPYFRLNDAVVNNRTQIDGRNLISYASYNYLGYSGDERVNARVQSAVDRYGTSVSASRVATGEKPLHQELEQALATLLGTEDCLVFVSGHATNVTTIGHLFGPDDLIVYDALSHNSIIQGATLSGATCQAFPHNNWRALDQMLTQSRHQYRRVLIAIEGIYSVDGDIADLPRFIEIKQRHRCLLLVDEAHSIGVLGATGAGIGEYYGVARNAVELWMGTLSKSFASCGGYIAGSKQLITYLKYTAPGFLYSVGMSPANTAAALAVAHLLPGEPERVRRLQDNAQFFLTQAKEAGLDTGLSYDSPVVPIVVDESTRALLLADRLFQRGINVQPLLHPIVPQNSARLRFFITSEHTKEELQHTVDVVAEELAMLEP